jgi:hypothetical protein
MLYQTEVRKNHPKIPAQYSVKYDLVILELCSGGIPRHLKPRVLADTLGLPSDSTILKPRDWGFRHSTSSRFGMRREFLKIKLQNTFFFIFSRFLRKWLFGAKNLRIHYIRSEICSLKIGQHRYQKICIFTLIWKM